MNIIIDSDSSVPAYEQIRAQVARMVHDGLLPAGKKLPSVRELARQLGVSVKTVRRSYDELVAENLIETRHGSGTFVVELPEVATGQNLRTREEMGGPLAELPPMRWEPYEVQSEFFHMPGSRRHTELIKFHQASPDPALFPFDRIKQVATNMLWYPKEYFFDIGHAQGFQPLVEYLEREMALAGVPMADGENDIIITGGFQRALTLVLEYIIRQGQKVAIEAPTYTGILNLLIAKRIDYVSIPVDSQGMDTEYLAGVLAQGEVRAVITMPTYHNPLGVTMSPERREHLLRLAARHRVPVIEDDWARQLHYEGEVPPPLKSLDPSGYVIHMGSFSKCFMPGLRIGWITCPAGLSLPLYRAKIGFDSGDAQFLQALLFEFISKGYFDKHLRKTLKEYRKRRNLMCKLLKDNLPPGCSFHVPQGGFTVWVELPEMIKTIPLLSLARELGLQFLPAAFCMPDRGDAPAFRLSFSRTSTDEIEEGILKLCRLITEVTANPGLLRGGAKSYEDLYR